MMKGAKTVEAMERVIPRDNALLTAFVTYAARHGLPARWYYINKSRGLLTNQIKAMLARDLVGYDAFIEILNQTDPAVEQALSSLREGKSGVNLKPSKH